MASRRHPQTRACLVLDSARVAYVPYVYDHSPRAGSFGREAAARIGGEAGRIAKTLIVRCGEEFVCAVVPVTGELSLKELAASVGAKNAVMADPHDAQRLTGYVVGGISPVGQARQLRTVIDETLLDHDEVVVSGGRRGFSVGLSPIDLVRLTSAVVAPIGSR
ncbi:MAG: Cys-tRNA(Pro) deacylase [Actinomycetaceae bacterium]|nr:Cys-tRNA(Pro) deacylase [Actinomycetaceae bacterium]